MVEHFRFEVWDVCPASLSTFRCAQVDVPAARVLARSSLLVHLGFVVTCLDVPAEKFLVLKRTK